MDTLYEELIDGWKVILTTDGKLYAVKYQDWKQKAFPYKEVEWYQRNGKGWVVRKRKNFVSLVKQIIRNEGFQYKDTTLVYKSAILSEKSL